MENHALQTLLAEEHIEVEFDVPTELELVQLGVFNFDDLDDDEYEGRSLVALIKFNQTCQIPLGLL